MKLLCLAALLCLLCLVQAAKKEEDWSSTFDLYKSEDGFVHKSGLKKMNQKLGVALTDAEVNNNWEKADKDNNKKLSKEEFNDYLNSISKGSEEDWKDIISKQKSTSDVIAMMGRIPGIEPTDLATLKESIDPQNTGKFDQKALLAILTSKYPSKPKK